MGNSDFEFSTWFAPCIFLWVFPCMCSFLRSISWSGYVACRQTRTDFLFLFQSSIFTAISPSCTGDLTSSPPHPSPLSGKLFGFSHLQSWCSMCMLWWWSLLLKEKAAFYCTDDGDPRGAPTPPLPQNLISSLYLFTPHKRRKSPLPALSACNLPCLILPPGDLLNNMHNSWSLHY